MIGLDALLGLDLEGTEWRLRGLCAQTDAEAFFPEKGGTTAAAKIVCHHCPVKADCLAHALAMDERFGVWGGLSERERRDLKRRQQSKVAA